MGYFKTLWSNSGLKMIQSIILEEGVEELDNILFRGLKIERNKSFEILIGLCGWLLMASLLLRMFIGNKNSVIQTNMRTNFRVNKWLFS